MQLSLQTVDFAYVLRQGQVAIADNARAVLDNPSVRTVYLGERR